MPQNTAKMIFTDEKEILKNLNLSLQCNWKYVLESWPIIKTEFDTGIDSEGCRKF